MKTHTRQLRWIFKTDLGNERVEQTWVKFIRSKSIFGRNALRNDYVYERTLIVRLKH